MSGLVVREQPPVSGERGHYQVIRYLLASKGPVEPGIVAGVVKDMVIRQPRDLRLMNDLLLHPQVDLRIKVAAGEKTMQRLIPFPERPEWLTDKAMTSSRVAVLQWLSRTDRMLATRKRDDVRMFLAGCLEGTTTVNCARALDGNLVIGAYVRQELYESLYQYAQYPFGWSAIPLLYKVVCYVPPAEPRREHWLTLGDAWKQGHELHAASTLIHLHLNVDPVRYDMGPRPFTVDRLFWEEPESTYKELAEYYRLK